MARDVTGPCGSGRSHELVRGDRDFTLLLALQVGWGPALDPGQPSAHSQQGRPASSGHGAPASAHTLNEEELDPTNLQFGARGRGPDGAGPGGVVLRRSLPYLSLHHSLAPRSPGSGSVLGPRGGGHLLGRPHAASQNGPGFRGASEGTGGRCASGLWPRESRGPRTGVWGSSGGRGPGPERVSSPFPPPAVRLPARRLLAPGKLAPCAHPARSRRRCPRPVLSRAVTARRPALHADGGVAWGGAQSVGTRPAGAVPRPPLLGP